MKSPELPREPGLELQVGAPGERFEGREAEERSEELGLARRYIALDERLGPLATDLDEAVRVAVIHDKAVRRDVLRAEPALAQLRACGELAKIGRREKFVPRLWRVDLGELSNRVAPCLIHMMDAYFSAQVLEYLAGRGVTEIIAVHDGWFVPASVEAGLYDDDGVPLSGSQLLAHAITYVGAEWLSGVGRIPDPDKPLRYFTTVPPDETRPGLAVVYDWFADSLRGSPYEAFASEVRDRWRRRVAEQRWPQFTASSG